MTEGTLRIVGPVPVKQDPEVEKAFRPLRKRAQALARAWAAEEGSNGSRRAANGSRSGRASSKKTVAARSTPSSRSAGVVAPRHAVRAEQK